MCSPDGALRPPRVFVLGFFVSSLINSRDARAGCGVVEGAPGAQAEKQAEEFKKFDGSCFNGVYVTNDIDAEYVVVNFV